MTDHTPAAQAAHTNPLSDEYVNAVIQQHGYQSPETVIARLNQWIGLHGGENGVTLLMYEAHKALVKLRAPVAHLGLPDVLPEFTNASGAQFVSMGTVGTVLLASRAALASAPPVFDRHQLRALVDTVWNEATESTAVPDTPWSDRMIDKVFPSVPASAPVAGERARDRLEAIAFASTNEPTAMYRHWWRKGYDTALAGAPIAGEAQPTDGQILDIADRVWREQEQDPTDKSAVLALVREVLGKVPVTGEAVPDGYVLLPAKETEAMHDAIMEHLYRGVSRTETQNLLDAYIKGAGASVMVDMTPPATARDRWMYEQGRLAERDPRTYAAPQASEAVRDALQDLVDVLQKRHFGRMPDEVQRAFDAARAALPAQPGAQKGGSDA